MHKRKPLIATGTFKMLARTSRGKCTKTDDDGIKEGSGIFRTCAKNIDIKAVADRTGVATKNIQNMFKLDVEETTTAIKAIKKYTKEELDRKYRSFS